MRTLRLSLAGTVILSLFVGIGTAVVVGQSDESTVPAGSFEREVLFDVTVPADAMPERLGRVNLEIQVVEPGVAVDVGIDNEAARGKSFYIESGQLVVEPMVDALHWKAASTVGGSPETIPPGVSTRLPQGSLILLPAVEPDELVEGAVLRLANPGTEPVQPSASTCTAWTGASLAGRRASRGSTSAADKDRGARPFERGRCGVSPQSDERRA